MALCKIVVEYDGTAYRGWQVQENGPSVQGELEKALERLVGERVRVRGAGRTDAGVHAKGQVAVFPLPAAIPPERIALALNTRLPPDICVARSEAVDDAFDPRRDCVRKRYSYSILRSPIRTAIGRRTAWHVKRPLDLAAMGRAAAMFVGEHDFTTFCNRELAGRDNRRRVERSEILNLGPDAAGRDRLVYVAEGRGFLYNMVRALAGTLVDVGAGRFDPGEVPELLRRRDRAAAGQSAPAWGLCLEWIVYAGEAPPDFPPGLF